MKLDDPSICAWTVILMLYPPRPPARWRNSLVMLNCYGCSRKAEQRGFPRLLVGGGQLFATFTSGRWEVGGWSRGMSKLQLGFLFWDKYFVKRVSRALSLSLSLSPPFSLSLAARLAALSTHALLAVQTCCFITSLWKRSASEPRQRFSEIRSVFSISLPVTFRSNNERDCGIWSVLCFFMPLY